MISFLLLVFLQLVRANLIPENCSEWFDGANLFKCEDGHLQSQITFKEALEYAAPFCAKFRDEEDILTKHSSTRVGHRQSYLEEELASSKGNIPEDCLIWFDGVNDCLCTLGEVTSILTNNLKGSDTSAFCKEYLAIN